MMLIKRTDVITEMIESFNLRDAGTERSINQVIEDWKVNVDNGAYENEEEIVEGLCENCEMEWNETNSRASTFLEDNCSFEIVKAIEDLYKYRMRELDYSDNELDLSTMKRTIEEKLDFCYYIQAEEEFKKFLEWEDFDLDFWG